MLKLCRGDLLELITLNDGVLGKGGGMVSRFLSLVLCWQAHDFYENLVYSSLIVYPPVLLFLLNTFPPFQCSKTS